MKSVQSAAHPRRKPTIDEGEVRMLAAKYGEPIRRQYDIVATTAQLTRRWREDSDRRAEVVFAIQGPGKAIWLHTKHTYPRPMFRLLSGGVEWDENVEDALLREVEEETSLPVRVERFVALLEYEFHNDKMHSERRAVQFASYLFLLRNCNGKPHPEGNDEVAEFHSILPRQLPEVAADLRNIMGERREWGRWRAIPHDVLYEAMMNEETE